MSQSSNQTTKRRKVVTAVLLGAALIVCGFYIMNPARVTKMGRHLLFRPPPFAGRVKTEIIGIGGGMFDYQQRYKTLPTGSNADVAKALLGDNPEKQTFTAWRKENLNATGEFVDPWGTPYDIKISSNGEIFIRSAGEDRVLGTRDDLDGTQ